MVLAVLRGAAATAWRASLAALAAFGALAGRRGRARGETTLAERFDSLSAQLGVLQAASARLSRASGVEAVGRAIVEETRRIIDYHNARVYLLESTWSRSRSRGRLASTTGSTSTS